MSAVSRHSSALRAPPPITWMRRDLAAGDRLEPLEHPAVLAGQRLEDAAHHRAAIVGAPGRRRRRRRSAPACRRARGSRRRRGRTAARRRRRPRPAGAARRSRASAHARRHSSSSHMPITFLSSRVVPSTPRSLVRFAGRRTRARAARARAATRCRWRGSPRARRAPARRRRRTRCRGWRPRRRCASPSSWWASSGAERACPARPWRRTGATAARGARSGRSPTRRVRASSSPVVEALVARWPARRTASSASRSGTSAMRSRGLERGRALVGQQLEDGVDRHRLDAGARVQLGLRARARRRARACRAVRLVAVVEGQPEQAAAAVQQPVVDAPGVRRRRPAPRPPCAAPPAPR